MAGQTAEEKGLAQAFLKELGAPDTATNEAVVTAWMRSETSKGDGTWGGVGASQNNVLGMEDAKGNFLSFPNRTASMIAAADALKANAKTNWAQEGPILPAFVAGNDPAYVIRVISQSGWDGSHYGWNPMTGGHIQANFQALGGNLYSGTPLAAVGSAEVGAQGALDSVGAVLGFTAQLAAFVADPQNWLRLGALFLGLIFSGVGGYILWQAT